MIEKYYFEFSKIYGRLMRLEMQIKKMLINSLFDYYKNDVVKVFNDFFRNKDRLKRYNSKNGNSLVAILNNPQMNQYKKFQNLINQLYLSDLLLRSEKKC